MYMYSSDNYVLTLRAIFYDVFEVLTRYRVDVIAMLNKCRVLSAAKTYLRTYCAVCTMQITQYEMFSFLAESP